MTFAAERGQFANLEGFDLGNGLFLQIFYQPTDVLLKVEGNTTVPEPTTWLLWSAALAAVSTGRKWLRMWRT